MIIVRKLQGSICKERGKVGIPGHEGWVMDVKVVKRGGEIGFIYLYI